nr:MAG TPA: hypothetical protein [Bacteriophage sp.]
MYVLFRAGHHYCFDLFIPVSHLCSRSLPALTKTISGVSLRFILFHFVPRKLCTQRCTQ